MKKDSTFDIIIKALDSLQTSIMTSECTINEKDTLSALVTSLKNYYEKKLKYLSMLRRSNKIIELNTFVTDIIVEINEVLMRKGDVTYHASLIYKKINK